MRAPGSGATNRITSTSPSGATRARAARSTCRKAAPWGSTAGSTGASGRRRTAPSARPWRSSPTASSSSAAGLRARAPSRSSCRAARLPRAPTLARLPTTTSRSDGPARPERGTTAQARPGSRRADPKAQLLLLPREDRRGRLQERAPAAAVRLREREDPFAAHHRRVPAPPAPGRRSREAGARDGAPPLLHGLMQVILRQDVEKIGLRGEVVDVAPGFARNYLLPRNLAETATPAKVAELRKHEEKRARQEAQSVDQAREIAERLEGTELRIDVRAGETGTLFGSVTATDIADAVWREKRVRVDRRKLDVPESIKRIGRYEVPTELFADVTATLRVAVVPEGGQLPPQEELEAIAAEEARAEAEAQAQAEAEHAQAEAEIEAVVTEEEAEEAPVEGEQAPPEAESR